MEKQSQVEVKPENQTMDPIDHLIEWSLSGNTIKLSEAEKAKYKDILKQILRDGKRAKEALGFSDEMIEHMYAYGFRLYNLGDYKKARDVFLALSILVPNDPRFSLALGSAYQRLKDYMKALEYYYFCGQQQLDNPMPYFYMYNCFLEGRLLGDAEVCINEVIKRCGKAKVFAKLKETAKLLLESLHKQIAELDAAEKAAEAASKKEEVHKKAA